MGTTKLAWFTANVPMQPVTDELVDGETVYYTIKGNVDDWAHGPLIVAFHDDGIKLQNTGGVKILLSRVRDGITLQRLNFVQNTTLKTRIKNAFQKILDEYGERNGDTHPESYLWFIEQMEKRL